jgi:C1A family cysteine protease
MKNAQRMLVLILILSCLVVMIMPMAVVAEDPKPDFGLGLVPSEGDFPKLDTQQLNISLDALPSIVDLSAGLPPVGNQGRQGSCVGWSLGYYYRSYQEGIERNWDINQPQQQFSPAWIYNQRPISDCSRDTGMSFYAGLRILKDSGSATLATVPYNADDACTQPSAAAREEATRYGIQSYANLFAGQGTANLTVLKSLLAEGQPFAIALPVYSSFYRVTYSNPVVPRHTEGESYFGGHAMLVVGYDDQIGGFKVVNSWGASWGRDGFAYLSYDFVRYDCWEAWIIYDLVDPKASLSNDLWGSVATVTGQSVPENSPVTAWLGDAMVAQSAIAVRDGVSSYALEIPADDPNTPEVEGGVDGALIRFKVGSTWAPETSVWQSGMSVEKDLTVPDQVNSSSSSLWLANFATSAGGWTSFDTYPRAVADVNGDGKADIVGFGNKGAYVALSTGSGFDAPGPWIEAFGYATNAGEWTSQNSTPRMMADVDGDGRADIVAFGRNGVLVSLSAGDGFGEPALWINNFGVSAGGWTSFDKYPRSVADVNGDGKADIVGFGNNGVYVALSTGSGFDAPGLWIEAFGYATSAGGWISQNVTPRLMADVDGDGKADIVAFGRNGVLVSLSAGDGFGEPALWINNFGVSAGGWTSFDRYPRAAADVNGDGKADIVGFGSKGTYLALSTGSGFATPELWNTEYGSSLPSGWSNYDLYPRTVANVSGSGLGDIVGFGKAGVYVSLSHK